MFRRSPPTPLESEAPKFSSQSVHGSCRGVFGLKKDAACFKPFQRQDGSYFSYAQSAKPLGSSNTTSEILGHLSECVGRTQ